MTSTEHYVLLSVPEASVLKAAAQAWMAGCVTTRHAGGHGPCAGHPALESAVSKVRSNFEAIVSERRRPAPGGEGGASS
jgi:hypothetical protein